MLKASITILRASGAGRGMTRIRQQFDLSVVSLVGDYFFESRVVVSLGSHPSKFFAVSDDVAQVSVTQYAGVEPQQ